MRRREGVDGKREEMDEENGVGGRAGSVAGARRGDPRGLGMGKAMKRGRSCCVIWGSESGRARPGEMTLEDVAAGVRRCRACALHRTRKKPVPGEGSGRSGVVLVGEAPGAKEDALGRPFVGSAGKLLDRMLRIAGLARSEVFITNVVKCRPPGNRPPKPAEVRACARHLRLQLNIIAPELVCTMGNSALRALVDPKGNITRLRGRIVEKDGRRYLPLYHPAAILYRRKLIKEIEEDFRRLGGIARRAGRAAQTRLTTEEE